MSKSPSKVQDSIKRWQQPLVKAGSYLCAPLEANVSIELQLLLLTFCTGIQDAIAFPDFLCFASNQTGNTVILTVALTGFRGEFFHLVNVAMSLSMFLIGALLAGQIGNFVGGRRRLWQLLSNFLQILLVFGASWIQFTHAPEEDSWTLGVIALLAFASGAQVATARAFKLPEISTAMATAAWVDLVIDPGILVLKNRSRTRRALFLVMLAAGSFAGAYMRSNLGSPWAVAISGIGKAVVIPMLLIARREQQPPSGAIMVYGAVADDKKVSV